MPLNGNGKSLRELAHDVRNHGCAAYGWMVLAQAPPDSSLNGETLMADLMTSFETYVKGVTKTITELEESLKGSEQTSAELVALRKLSIRMLGVLHDCGKGIHTKGCQRDPNHDGETDGCSCGAGAVLRDFKSMLDSQDP